MNSSALVETFRHQNSISSPYESDFIPYRPTWHMFVISVFVGVLVLLRDFNMLVDARVNFPARIDHFGYQNHV